MADLYDVFFALEPRKRWLGILVIVLGIALSAWIGASVDGFIARARPNIELGAIRFSGVSQKTTKLSITPSLQKAYGQAPFILEDLKPQITLETLQAMIVTTQSYCDEVPVALDVLSKVESKLKESTLDADKPSLRRELLTLWTEDPTDILEKTLQAIAIKSSHFSETKYDYYKKDPVEAQWASPDTSVVSLSAFKSYRLTTEKIELTDDPTVTYAKLRVNLYRRLWIYLDRELLLDLLRETETSVKELLDSTHSFRDALNTFEAANNPNRIEVTIVVTNTGKEPVVLRTFGLLRLWANQDHVDVQVVANVDDLTVEDGVITVPGGEGRTIKYYSEKTAKEISTESYHGNLEEGIYKDNVLECTFSGLCVSNGSDDIVLMTKKRANFGAKVVGSSFQKLKNQP